MEVGGQLPERRVPTRGGLRGMSPSEAGGRLAGVVSGPERIRPNSLFLFLRDPG